VSPLPGHRPDGGYAGEVAWLTLVTEVYARSPVVAQTIAATREPAAPSTPQRTAGDARR
jgi:hypothetical protein